MKTKKIRVIASVLIAALIATLYAPVSAYAAYINGSVNSQPGVGDVVVGTPIDQDIDIIFVSSGSSGYVAGWYHSDDLTNIYTNYNDINGLFIFIEKSVANGFASCLL